MGILSEYRFQESSDVWKLPVQTGSSVIEIINEGCIVTPVPEKEVSIQGSGVHTRNGDVIELRFSVFEEGKGVLTFGYSGGMEHAIVKLNFNKRCISLFTSDWTCSQPICSSELNIEKKEFHTLRIGKTEGKGKLVKNADIEVFVDGEKLISQNNINVLPEMGVIIGIEDLKMMLRSFTHMGNPSSIPEYLVVGGWQVLNENSIEKNLNSIYKGLIKATEEGVQLLVTPETSLTGLFSNDPVTNEPAPINDAERKLRQFIHELKNAPYLIAGFPIWENVQGHSIKMTRYNVSRVYDPDGEIVATCPKIHTCEPNFWHGFRLHEFNIYGVPVTMHICHDWGYPELRTLPVMFGARLILRPANDGIIKKSIEAFEAVAKMAAIESHAFYMNVNGGGGSFLIGPQAYYDGLIAVSPECKRDNSSFPMVDKPQEGLFYSKIRIHDAFGYWPVRSFRASESVAEAYLSLYKNIGGK